MVVKNIFKEVEYPSDEESIEHIIREYDKRLQNIWINTKDIDGRCSEYVMLILTVIAVIYTLSCWQISIIVRSLYIVPCTICMIYYLKVVKFQKEEADKLKGWFKIIGMKVMLVYNFLYIGIFFGEIQFCINKWQDREYFFSAFILIILSIISIIIARIKAPKKFINQYQYKKRKVSTSITIIKSMIVFFACIINVHKPYRIIVIASYIILIILSGIMTYVFFEYSQYDKIQELKKQINYKPKNK